MSTPLEQQLTRVTDADLEALRRELRETLHGDETPAAETWRRLLRAVQVEQGRRIAATTPPGCCTNCAGTGRDAGAPETGGLCWDCRGTGHDHVDLEPTDQCPAVE